MTGAIKLHAYVVLRPFLAEIRTELDRECCNRRQVVNVSVDGH